MAQSPLSVPLTFECQNVEDLQLCLHQMVEANLRSLIPVRICATFELGSQATFNVSPPKKSGRPVPGIDPVSHIEASSDAQEQAVRIARAADLTNTPVTGNFTTLQVVQNQPDREPVLQSSIARSVVASVREVDGFGWSLKNKSRSQKHGWQIEYFCQDSKQNRDRQGNGRRRARPSSDLRREKYRVPTFDCKGCLLVIFSWSLGKVIVRYSHSPIHRTIASRQELKNEIAASQASRNKESSIASETANYPQLTQRIQSQLPLSGGSYSEPPQSVSQPGNVQVPGNETRSVPLTDAQNVKKTRSKDGCLHCRKDRVKCDEIHPICKRCDRQRHACEWPESRPDKGPLELRYEVEAA